VCVCVCVCVVCEMCQAVPGPVCGGGVRCGTRQVWWVQEVEGGVGPQGVLGSVVWGKGGGGWGQVGKGR